MFIGRTDELAKLKREANKSKASLLVVRGRRRIGKSTLLEQFGQEFPRCFIFQGLAPRKNLVNKHQLQTFARQFSEHFDLPEVVFHNWHEALSELAKRTAKGKVLIVLDEISWMASKDADFVGELKIAWDLKFKKNDKLVLVLCGSISSWIDENILNSSDFLGRVSLRLSLGELELPLCHAFWRDRQQRISALEKLKLLSVTGGVPRYLEEIIPSESAESNIKALCFDPAGILFQEFESIFNDVFDRRAATYQTLVRSLIHGHKGLDAICRELDCTTSGTFSRYLEDLESAGFIRRQFVYSPHTGKRKRFSTYRLSDNYVRFYLRYIEPARDRIQAELYQFKSLENLAGYEAIMGLQFENLVLNNLHTILDRMNIAPDTVISASPYYQNRTRRQQACQIDLLIHTRYTLHVCEIKFQQVIPATVIKETQAKIATLTAPKSLSIRPTLIYGSKISETLEQSHYFDHLISFESLLG